MSEEKHPPLSAHGPQIAAQSGAVGTRNDTASPAPSRADLEAESDVIPYAELQKFFAKGMLVAVDPNLNLVDVALAMAADDAGRLQQWADNGLVQRAHDEHARAWHADKALLRAVTVTPWILVQDTGETVLQEPAK